MQIFDRTQRVETGVGDECGTDVQISQCLEFREVLESRIADGLAIWHADRLETRHSFDQFFQDSVCQLPK